MSIYRSGSQVTLTLLQIITLIKAYGYPNCYLAYNNAEYADCVGRKVMHLPLSIQHLPNQTRWLNISQNEIRTVEHNVFSHLPNLLELQLSKNKINTIQTQAFNRLNNLHVLDLSYNAIDSLDNLDLASLTSLRIFHVNHNKICAILNESLLYLTALEELDLSSNCISNFRIVARAVEHLTTFYRFNLSSNSITSLSNEQSLIVLPYLQYLNLCNNSIFILDLIYYFMPNLTELNVLRNQMYDVNGSSFLNVPNLSNINFDENPLNISNLLGSHLPNLAEFHWSSMRPALQNDLLPACQFFQTLPALRWLDIKHCKIKNSKLEVIGQCTNLTTLILSTTAIIRLVKNDLQSFKQLEVLYLDKCKINEIQGSAWTGLESLHTLILQRNRLSVLQMNMFSPLVKLQVLDLSKNPVIHIARDAFNGLHRLKVLSLKSCKIAEITSFIFKQVFSLRELDIRDNILSVIKAKSFDKLYLLQTLLLSGNKISSVKKYGLHGLRLLKHLSLADNLLYVVTNFTFCHLKSLVSLNLSQNHLGSFQKYQSPNPFLHLKDLESLDLSYQNQRFEVSIPKTYFEGLQSLKHLNLRGNPSLFLKNMTLSRLRNLTELDLSELYPWSDLSERLKPELFQNLTQLRVLRLEKNEIRDLSGRTFAQLPLLENLSLKNNKLGNISKNLLRNMSHLRFFDVYMNPLSCSCDNYWFQNWSEFNIKVQVPFVQSYNCFGQIASDVNFLSYDLSFCGTDISVFFFIGSFLATLSLMTVSLLISKGKWSILYGYYMLRVWFQCKIQKQERLYQYDAYVCYCPDDEQWVIEHLLLQLESQGQPKYKLCFKPRDFIPGCYHIDNIQDAISSSRKTLCVVSRRFLANDSCKMEMEMACSRVFYQKEDVLVMVFLEDIPDYKLSAYHKLRKLIKQNMYIDWPDDPQGEELFWFKLRKALGKVIYEEDPVQL
ncbi:uncharacterized protein RCH25_008019 [Pelodytes ibericus]